MNIEAFNDRYPEHFVEMGRIERARYPLSELPKPQGDVRIFLDELDPKAGRQQDEVEISCSAFCNTAAESLGLESSGR